MPDPHPFNGRWNSYGLNPAKMPFPDGEIHLEITPGGGFTRGRHFPSLAGGGLGPEVTLSLVSISNTKIEVKELDGAEATYEGHVIKDTEHGNRKVIIGKYTIPEALEQPLGSEARRPSDVALTQINGTWVATQP